MALTIPLLLAFVSCSVIHRHTVDTSAPTQLPREDTSRDNYLCGKPLPGNSELIVVYVLTRCQPFIKDHYPDCKSFPGKPDHVTVQQNLDNNRHPVFDITWDSPSTGFSDLWGFQVYVISQAGKYYKCIQVNKKERTRSSIRFWGLNFGAQYDIQLQSMPPNNHSNLIRRSVIIQERCTIDEFRHTPICCQISNVLVDVCETRLQGRQMINVTWELTCNNIQQFKLAWENDHPYYHTKCSGSADISHNNSYLLLLPDDCNSLLQNYTAKIYGIIANKQMETKPFSFWFTVPKSLPATSTTPTSAHNSTPSRNMSVIAVVIGTGLLLGVVLAILVFKIFRRRGSSIIRIVSRPYSECDTEEMQLPDPVKVLILYTNCCQSCKRVIYCLWDVLDCTNLFDVRLDMLSEPKLNENPLRWYETQVKEATRVLLVASRLMLMADMDSFSSATTESNYVSMRYQLNLLRGELSNTTDMSKYVPVYMNYNGSKEDIPRFLTVCRAYELAPEIDKAMFQLLGMSSVRKHPSKPIVQVDSNSHPYNEKKDAFEKAISDAEHYHREQNMGQRPTNI